MADLSTMKLFPWTQSSINKNCLVQGFNLQGPNPWQINSRIVLQSQQSSQCGEPYMVRGVGIGFSGITEISCGEMIIAYTPEVKSYPAFCRIYIQ